MTTVDLITALFYEVDEQLRTIPKHPEAHLWPSEVGTSGLLHALKGVGNRPFYRWVTRDYRPLFPRLPERTRLFRLLKTHQDWTQVFLAAPTVLGGIDTYGIELIHPMREGRSPQQIGRKGVSNHRWIVGGKLCLLLNQWGLVVGWACATANVADNTFQWLIQQVDGRMIVLSDTCGPQNYRCLLPTSGDVRFWSSLLTSSRSKASGSNSPPIHASISSCSGCCGSCIASRKLAYPQIPPQSSGGQARLPVRHTG